MEVTPEDEIKLLRQETQRLREDVAKLRQEIDEVDDWANGVHVTLTLVLPRLLRGHPKERDIRKSLQRHDDRYEELQAHPERAEDEHERLGLYESGKMLNRLLQLLEHTPHPPPRTPLLWRVK
jgi:uncharacterized coiled-coil DUF342 family protein